MGKVFDRALAEAFAFLVKAEAFERRGQLWNRRRNGRIEVIQLQRSQYNIRERASFTINIGVRRALLVPNTYFVKHYQCWHWQRIGKLLPAGQDKWYHYDEIDELRLEAAMTDAVDDVRGSALPWLDGRPSLGDLSQLILDIHSALQMRRGKI